MVGSQVSRVIRECLDVRNKFIMVFMMFLGCFQEKIRNFKTVWNLNPTFRSLNESEFELEDDPLIKIEPRTWA